MAKNRDYIDATNAPTPDTAIIPVTSGAPPAFLPPQSTLAASPLIDPTSLAIEHVVSIGPDPGMALSVTGIYEGPGPEIELAEEDKQTGEVKTVQTWRVRVTPKFVALVTGRYQIDRFLAKRAPGVGVSITYYGTIKGKGARNINQYLLGEVAVKQS